MSDPSSHNISADVAIVGGGMVGVSLALLLARHLPGAKIVLVEMMAFPQPGKQEEIAGVAYGKSFDARSTALSESSRRLYQELDLWPALTRHLTPIEQIHVSDRGHIGSTTMLAKEQGLPALGYVVENQWLGQVLLSALSNQPAVEMVAPATVSAVKMSSQGARLSLSTGQQVSADLLVVADGAHSSTRSLLGIGQTKQAYGQTAIITNVSFSRPHDEVAYERFTESGPIALLPLQDYERQARSALIWTVPTSAAEELLKLSEAGFLHELQQCFGHRLGEFQQIGKRDSYPLQLVTSDELYRRGVAVVGNAATALHPVAGQGFNLALRGVSVLVDLLGAAWAKGLALGDLSLLKGYADRHQRDRQQIVAFSDALPKLFGSSALPVALGRNLGLLAVDAVPVARRLFTGFASGASVFRAGAADG